MAKLVRKGFDLLMAAYPDADLLLVRPSMTWLSVDLLDVALGKMEFAVWRQTGCVYHVREGGDVHDDPFLVPEGSSYRGYVEGRSQEVPSQD